VTEFTGSESDPAVQSVCEIEIEIGDRRLGPKRMPDFPSNGDAFATIATTRERSILGYRSTLRIAGIPKIGSAERR